MLSTTSTRGRIPVTDDLAFRRGGRTAISTTKRFRLPIGKTQPGDAFPNKKVYWAGLKANAKRLKSPRRHDIYFAYCGKRSETLVLVLGTELNVGEIHAVVLDIQLDHVLLKNGEGVFRPEMGDHLTSMRIPVQTRKLTRPARPSPSPRRIPCRRPPPTSNGPSRRFPDSRSTPRSVNAQIV